MPCSPDSLPYEMVIPIALLSLLSCIAIVVIYYSYETLRHKDFNFVCILSVFDGLLNLVTLIPVCFINNSTLCAFQGVCIQIFSFSGILWTGLIGLTMYLKIVHEKDFDFDLWKSALSILIFTSITALFPLISTNAYEFSGAWCWFSSVHQYSNLFRFGLFYSMTWGVIIFNLVTNLQIVNKI